jgi:hypothetical protein
LEAVPLGIRQIAWISSAHALECSSCHRSFFLPNTVLYAQVYRYRRVSTPRQRQQTKWVIYGVLISILGFVGIIVVGNLLGLGQPPGTWGFLWASTAIYVVEACLPLSLGIAILRSRLWDIDVIINKTLVYGLLTGLLGALYAGLIIGLQSLAGLVSVTANQPIVLVVSTLAIAALFQPVRHRVQAFIDRRFYRRSMMPSRR